MENQIFHGTLGSVRNTRNEDTLSNYNIKVRVNFCNKWYGNPFLSQSEIGMQTGYPCIDKQINSGFFLLLVQDLFFFGISLKPADPFAFLFWIVSLY